MIALARIMLVFGSVCTQLWRRGPPSLLHNNSSVDVSALARPEFVIGKLPVRDTTRPKGTLGLFSRLFTVLILVYLSSFLHYYSQNLESVLEKEIASHSSVAAVRLSDSFFPAAGDRSPTFMSIKPFVVDLLRIQFCSWALAYSPLLELRAFLNFWQQGPHPDSCLANPPSRAPVPHQPDAEGVVDTLMRQVELPFSVADLLYMYTVVRPKREPGTPFFIGKWEFRAGDDSLFSFPRHNGYFNDLFKNQSEECKATIRTVTTGGPGSSTQRLHLVRSQCRAQRGRAPCLAPAKPIPISSSDAEHSDDLAYNPLQITSEVEIAHSFREGDESDISLSEMLNRVYRKHLCWINAKGSNWQGGSKKAKKRRGRRALPSSLPPVLKLNFGSLSFHHRAQQTSDCGWLYQGLRYQFGLYTEPLESYCHLEADEGISHVARSSSGCTIEEYTELATTTISNWPSFTLDTPGGLACLKELDIPPDHHAWSTNPPEVELIDHPQSYSLLMLPGFNEEELLEQVADEVLKKTPEVACELGQETTKANVTAEDVYPYL
ncbi:hypothetical protein Acr_28g0004250 [Actinidia rufa]|uniref:Uncharacterized protein n=1 Tax=Actinidia rufa TaxID=165716 RepID=A0A7J0H9B9_9ERIC|nr:hypothetical protein Acr_28g0004250 [Actinidia rufa]